MHTHQGLKARIIEQQKNLFKVYDGEQEWWAEPCGRLRHQAQGSEDQPVVGDWVYITPGAPGDRLQILEILPRHSLLQRRAIGQDYQSQLLAANVDHVFVVSSLNHDLNRNRLDRYRLLIQQSGAQGTLLLTKADLIKENENLAKELFELGKTWPIVLLSVVDGRGLAELSGLLKSSETAVFIGSSGVGKSTLLNALLGESRQETGGIRLSDSKGRHTTSSRSLITLPSGAHVIDTPGLRELGLWNLDHEQLREGFGNLETGACRFRNCQHESEPGCAVLAALASGEVDQQQLASFRKLQREQKYFARKEDPRQSLAEKNRWKVIHKEAKRARRQRDKG